MVDKEAGSTLWRNRNWRMLWLGQGISQVGDFVFDVTLVLWVGTVLAKGLSWAPLAVSGILIAAAVPVALVGPLAGVFVDRWDRRRTMLVADAGRAVLILGLLALPSIGRNWPPSVSIAVVYAVTALTSVLSQFFNPARFAMTAAVVEEGDQERAFSMVQATSSTAGIIGPPLAAPLLFTVGVEWALVVNAMSFVVSFLSVMAIRVPEVEQRDASPKTSFREDLTAGLRFFAQSRVLRALAVSLCIYTAGVGALNVLDVFFVGENLHTTASWLGTLGAAFGVGSIAGALLAGRVARTLGARRLYWIGLVITGLLILCYSRMSVLPLAIVALALTGLPVGAVGAVVGPLVLQTTPRSMIGRVSAVVTPMMQMSSIAAMALAGFLASTVFRDMHVVVGGVTFSRIDTVFGCSALLMIVAGLSVVRPFRAQSGSSEAVPDDGVTDPGLSGAVSGEPASGVGQ